MKLEVKGKTRQNLLARDACFAVQKTLLGLTPDVLDVALAVNVDDRDRSLDRPMNLREAGALLRELEMDANRPIDPAVSAFAAAQVAKFGPAPYQRRMASVYLLSSDAKRNVYVSADEYPVARSGQDLHLNNRVTVECMDVLLRGENLSKFAHSICVRLFDNDIFDHGVCYLEEEFDEKNFDRTGGGMRAVGMDVAKSLSGFYWGNYFGEYFCDLVGRDVLMHVPCCSSQEVGAGILVTHRLSPDRYATDQYRTDTRAAIDHIGNQLFFEKGKEMTGRLFTFYR